MNFEPLFLQCEISSYSKCRIVEIDKKALLSKDLLIFLFTFWIPFMNYEITLDMLEFLFFNSICEIVLIVFFFLWNHI